MYDATTGATYSHNAVTNYVTASIVKATILATLLRQAQDVGRSLTATERSLATRMIEQSDNSATTALWNQVGRGPAVGAFMKKVGMPSTTPGPDGLWGLTSTNTPDQVRLVRTVAFPNAVLSNASRAYEASLMRGVTPSQKWGVSGGVPASATVALKNGWLPRTGGWVINSIGHVQGGTRNYVIAVLSSGVPGMSYGIKTIEQVSSMVWVSDFSGDGVTDLVARDSAGRLWLYPGNGSGGFRPRHQLGFGWSQLAMIVTPGDVTGDDNADVVARDAAGRLWLYSGNGAGGLSARRQIGSGWRGFTAISRAADLNRAGRPDLLARDSAGVLWLYPLTGNAQFGKRLRIGPGWSGYTILGSGDMSGDARADVLARDRTGSLWLYRGNGAGGLSVRTLVSRGWPASALLFTNGNWDRAGGSDLLARDGTGRLFVYPGNNAGQLGVRRQIGVGWSGMTFLG
ncbi:MAG: hypothetical protein QOE58_74 [Actinomycetota bacterium]|nr:hypothetical protein [Actinomycetota bacterium]